MQCGLLAGRRHAAYFMPMPSGMSTSLFLAASATRRHGRYWSLLTLLLVSQAQARPTVTASGPARSSYAPRATAVKERQNAVAWARPAASRSTAASEHRHIAAAPTITSFTPTGGGVNTVVIITGTGFTGTTAVRFNGVLFPDFIVNSDTQLTAAVPTGATTGPISVTTPSGTGTSSTNFTAPLAVASTSPVRNANQVSLASNVSLTYGKVLVGGVFTSYNGSTALAAGVLRLNADGTLDTTFNPSGSGANGSVQTLAVQADGKLLAGGSFTSYNGNAAAPDYLLRLSAEGTLNDAATGCTYASNAVVVTITEPLPVTLTSFTAVAQPSGARLNWSTALEHHSHYFAVERSLDGQQFTESDRVAAAGTSGQPRHYELLDTQPLAGGPTTACARLTWMAAFSIRPCG